MGFGTAGTYAALPLFTAFGDVVADHGEGGRLCRRRSWPRTVEELAPFALVTVKVGVAVPAVGMVAAAGAQGWLKAALHVRATVRLFRRLRATTSVSSPKSKRCFARSWWLRQVPNVDRS